MRLRIGWLVLFVPILGMVAARAEELPACTAKSLSCRSWCELEEIYRLAKPGAAPCGFYRGHVVYRPDDFLSGPRSNFVNFAWQGKHFGDGALVNQFRGVRMIRAEVAPGASWLDGGPAHILDYQHASFLWRDVRDEVREAAPGVYVGAMFLRRCPDPRLKVFFILEADPCGSGASRIEKRP